MNNEKFNQIPTIKGITKHIFVEFSTDYERLIEYCHKEIRRLKSTSNLIVENPPANTTKEEVKLIREQYSGEIRAYEDMIQQLEKRLPFEGDGE